MPTYQVTDPQTGVSLRLTGDSPPTEQELEQIFAQQAAPAQPIPQVAAQPPAQPTQQPQAVQALGIGPQVPGTTPLVQEAVQAPQQTPLAIGKPEVQQFVEPALTMATGMIAEPIAGLAGLITAPFQGAEQATKNIETVREALTFVPRTPEGMESLKKIAEVLQPVTETVQAVEKGLGEAGFEAAGPVGGAIGETLPTAAVTALGFGSVRRVLGGAKIKEAAQAVKTGAAKKLLKEAAPTIDGLKDAARVIYRGIDDIGATVNPGRVDRLSTELRGLAKKQGFNARIHPKVSAALDEIESVSGQKLTLSEIDTLRKVVRGAAKSIEPDEARIGSMLIDKIDDTLDSLQPTDFGNVKPKEIGAQYKDARQLWRRAKKAELLEDAFERASLQASGFENGIRVQFRSILNNKKKRTGFKSEELAAMRQVVKGGTAENIAKMIGRFGFSEGQASNMLMGSLGVAGGAAVGGPAGAVAVPLIGQVSRGLAQKLTRNNAQAADLIVRAGNDGLEIAKAYLKSVKPNERNVSELTELLLRPEISLKKLKTNLPDLPPAKKLTADAAFFAAFLRSQQEQE